MSERILITGASGFIGTNLLQDFIDNGFEVMNIDSRPPRNKAHLHYWSSISLLEREKLEQTILSFDPHYLIHMAARTDLDGETINDYEANTTGVKNLLEIIEKLPSIKKVLITSSMLVCKAGYQPKDQFDFCPTTIYGESKVITEKLVWENPPKCDWAIVRPTSMWGPWFGVPYRSFFDMVIAKRYFHVGDRGCTKTYGYIGNGVYQTKQLLFTPTPDKENKVFYLGDEPPTNIEEWGNEIAAELGYTIPKMPYGVVKAAALFGDALKQVGMSFPMTSFRLRNMTTDNVLDLSKTFSLAPNPPFARIEGIKKTLAWMTEQKRKASAWKRR